MKTVFKKTLIATAALAFVGAANAASIRTIEAELGTATATSANGSLEGLLDAGSLTANTDVVIRLKNAVTNVEQDVLVITVAGAKFDTTVTNPVLTAQGTQTGGYEFFDYQGEDTMRFRVKTGGVAVVAGAPQHFILENAKLKVGSVTAGSKVTVSSKVVSLNAAIGEYDKATFDLIKVRNQLSAEATTKFDATIATAKSRKEFVQNANVSAGGADAAVVTITNNGSDLKALPVTATETAKVVHVFGGDWSFLRDADKKDFGGDASGSVNSGEIDNLVVATATDDTFTYALSADNKLTVTQTAAGTLDTAVTLTFTPAAKVAPTKAASAVAINKTSFTLTSTASTTDSSFSVAADAAVGGFDVDGSVVKVPYLVQQTGRFGTILQVANSGTRTGEIIVDIVDDAGMPIATVSGGDSTPGSIVNVAGVVGTAVAAKKDVTKLTKYSVTITTNVPANDVLVYSAYTDAQNGGERAIVNNDSKVQTK